MPWVIHLTSKHTGEGVWLGAQYPTREAAKEAAERDVCSRCQRWETWHIEDGMHWVDRHVGFKPLNWKGAR